MASSAQLFMRRQSPASKRRGLVSVMQMALRMGTQMGQEQVWGANKRALKL